MMYARLSLAGEKFASSRQHALVERYCFVHVARILLQNGHVKPGKFVGRVERQHHRIIFLGGDGVSRALFRDAGVQQLGPVNAGRLDERPRHREPNQDRYDGRRHDCYWKCARTEVCALGFRRSEVLDYQPTAAQYDRDQGNQ